MRCDLHVHSIHSGMCTVAGLRHFTRESYTDPEELAERLRVRGMDLITITDHDSIAAADRLGREPDFFMSEEVTCHTPSGTEAHIGVYDINQRQHHAIQARRDDLPRLAAYLAEQEIFATVNHVASTLTGPRRARDFEAFLGFEAFEALNGQVPAANNACAAALGRRWRRCLVAGSDAHTLDSAARAYTEVPGARTRQEFFAGLRAGRARLCGLAGSWLQLTRDVLGIAGSLAAEHPAAVVLSPLLPLVPAATALQFLVDFAAAAWWRRRLLTPDGRAAIKAPLAGSDAAL